MRSVHKCSAIRRRPHLLTSLAFCANVVCLLQAKLVKGTVRRTTEWKSCVVGRPALEGPVRLAAALLLLQGCSHAYRWFQHTATALQLVLHFVASVLHVAHVASLQGALHLYVEL